jgi:hypothetical protein
MSFLYYVRSAGAIAPTLPLIADAFSAIATGGTTRSMSTSGEVGDTIYMLGVLNWSNNSTYQNATEANRVPVGFTLHYVARENFTYKYPIFIWKKTATVASETVTIAPFVSEITNSSMAIVRVPAGVDCIAYDWSLADITHSSWTSAQVPYVASSFSWASLTLPARSIVIDVAHDLPGFLNISGSGLPLLARTGGNSGGVYYGATVDAGTLPARAGVASPGSGLQYAPAYTTLIFR